MDQDGWRRGDNDGEETDVVLSKELGFGSEVADDEVHHCRGVLAYSDEWSVGWSMPKERAPSCEAKGIARKGVVVVRGRQKTKSKEEVDGLDSERKLERVGRTGKNGFRKREAGEREGSSDSYSRGEKKKEIAQGDTQGET